MPIAGDKDFEVGFETHGWGQETRMRAATAAMAAMDDAMGSLWQGMEGGVGGNSVGVLDTPR